MIRVKRLHPHAKIPQRAHDTDLGYDLFAAESVTIFPNEQKMVKTGIALQFPDGWGGFVKDRSSMATKTSLHTIAGVIDNSYVGEIIVVLMNFGTSPQTIESGQKMAQLVLIPVPEFSLEEVDELSDNTDRKNRGFGSTGT